ncbi:glycosyltransferase [Flavimarina sp. Hel_I_48]|uniref:glycosyltransferase n=1 Tax=Flavimarina sp. Hel_I_48 TaxID=1392488 RepID=UPI0009DE72C5|nr:glycosyltransferase [Flavimarina sp. Hel_I_48]
MLQVSIIIPMYNVSHFLKTCVESVLDQHMDDNAFEVLMIDDGSPDDSKIVAEKLAEKHAFINVFSQENKGLGGARNTGIKNASGKYLVFLDADDILISDQLLDIIQIAQVNALDILEFGAQHINESGEVLTTIAIDGKGEVLSGMNYYNATKYMNSACNKLYRTEFMRNNNLLFLEQIYAEDFEFNTRSLFFAERVMATNTIAAQFLQSTGSITRNRDKDKKDKYVEDLQTILTKIDSFRQDQKSNTSVDKKLMDNYFMERISMGNLGLFFFLFKNNYSYKEIKEIRKNLIEKNLYQNSYKVSDKNRDLFRRVLLKNFFLFRFIQPLKKAIGQ